MARMKIRFRNEGFREIRTSEGVREDLRQRAARVAQAAGDGVEVLPEQEPRNRAHLVVAPVTPEAETMVASDNALLRALEAGRD
jgi:hypothetical protein